MSIRSMINPNVATIDSRADIRRAATLMRQEHVGDLIVTERRDGKTLPTGVITDRDIVVEVVARGADPGDVLVGDTIRRDLVKVSENADVHAVLREMRQAGVRRVPVVDADGKVVGILSLDDVIAYIAKQLHEIAGIIEREQELEARELA